MINEKTAAHKQMRILRLRYDELNRSAGRLVLKTDMEKYIERLQGIVNRALKNSGFDKQPIYVDRKMSTRVPTSQIQNKGNVLRR